MLRLKYKYLLLGLITFLIIFSVPSAKAINIIEPPSSSNSSSNDNVGNAGGQGSTPTNSNGGLGNIGGQTPTPGSTKNSGASTNIIVTNYIDPAIKFLGIGFGLIIIITMMIGGIQYMTAGSNPQAIAGARKRIGNALFALILFTFMFALLQWLMPGGVF